MNPRLPLTILLLVILTLTAGCWNRREPENLAFILATGWDYDEENEEYIVMVQIAIPAQFVAFSDGGGAQKAFWVHAAKGKTPFTAIRELAKGSPREMFFAHNRLVLFSEKLARKGISPVLDMLNREHQFRLTVRPAIVRGDLKAIMEATFPMEPLGATGMDKQILTILLERSIFPVKTLLDVFTVFGRPGQDMLIGQVIAPNTSDATATNPLVITSGAALFSGDRMVGWASPDEVQGWNMVLDRGFRVFEFLSCPEDENKFFTVDFIGYASKLTPIVTEDELKVEIIIKTSGRIQDFSCSAKKLDDKYLLSLDKIASNKLRNKIEAMISRSKELRSDIVGIGNLFYRKYPNIWWDLEKDWYEIYSDIEIDVTVDADILISGMI